jgi:hypothetical protein
MRQLQSISSQSCVLFSGLLISYLLIDTMQLFMSGVSEQLRSSDDGVAFLLSYRRDFLCVRQPTFAEPRGQATDRRVLREIPIPWARATTSDLVVKDLFHEIVQSLI